MLGLGLALVAPRASAAPCPVDPKIGRASVELSATDAATRIEFIRDRIERGAKPSRQWALGWGIGLGLVAVAQLAASPLVHHEERPDFYMGALQAAIGAGSRAIFIPHVLIERRRLRRQPAGADDCAALARAERALAKSAHWEKLNRALWQHFLSLAINAGIGVALGLGFDRPVPGARLANIGGIVGQVMIITQPTPMVRALDAYRAGPRASGWSVRPLSLLGGGGLSIGGAI